MLPCMESHNCTCDAIIDSHVTVGRTVASTDISHVVRFDFEGKSTCRAIGLAHLIVTVIHAYGVTLRN